MRALGLPATVAAVVWIGLLLRGRDTEPRLVVAPAGNAVSPSPASITQFLASRPASEKQALSDALARFARTPAPAEPLPPPRALRGPPDAPVHLVEWTDLLCPHCRHLNETLEQLRQSIPPDRLAIEARQYPLDGRCNPAVPLKGDGLRCDGALVQICLEKAPDYWTLRDKLFAAQRTLTRESMMDIASSGLTPRSQLEACIASDEARARLVEDIRYCELYHPTGTPVVAINGKVVAQPLPVFLYALVMANGDPTAPLLTSALPPARHATTQ
jgi:serine/threonine-protein kinase